LGLPAILVGVPAEKAVGLSLLAFFLQKATKKALKQLVYPERSRRVQSLTQLEFIMKKEILKFF
jgi:hypothetical protein